MNANINRRTFLKAAAGMATLGAAGILAAPRAAAVGPVLGTVIDYAAGVPSAASIKPQATWVPCAMSPTAVPERKTG